MARLCENPVLRQIWQGMTLILLERSLGVLTRTVASPDPREQHRAQEIIAPRFKPYFYTLPGFSFNRISTVSIYIMGFTGNDDLMLNRRNPGHNYSEFKAITLKMGLAHSSTFMAFTCCPPSAAILTSFGFLTITGTL